MVDGFAILHSREARGGFVWGHQSTSPVEHERVANVCFARFALLAFCTLALPYGYAFVAGFDVRDFIPNALTYPMQSSEESCDGLIYVDNCQLMHKSGGELFFSPSSFMAQNPWKHFLCILKQINFTLSQHFLSQNQVYSLFGFHYSTWCIIYNINAPILNISTTWLHELHEGYSILCEILNWTISAI